MTTMGDVNDSSATKMNVVKKMKKIKTKGDDVIQMLSSSTTTTPPTGAITDTIDSKSAQDVAVVSNDNRNDHVYHIDIDDDDDTGGDKLKKHKKKTKRDDRRVRKEGKIDDIIDDVIVVDDDDDALPVVNTAITGNASSIDYHNDNTKMKTMKKKKIKDDSIVDIVNEEVKVTRDKGFDASSSSSTSLIDCNSIDIDKKTKKKKIEKSIDKNDDNDNGDNVMKVVELTSTDNGISRVDGDNEDDHHNHHHKKHKKVNEVKADHDRATIRGDETKHNVAIDSMKAVVDDDARAVVNVGGVDSDKREGEFDTTHGKHNNKKKNGNNEKMMMMIKNNVKSAVDDDATIIMTVNDEVMIDDVQHYDDDDNNNDNDDNGDGRTNPKKVKIDQAINNEQKKKKKSKKSKARAAEVEVEVEVVATLYDKQQQQQQQLLQLQHVNQQTNPSTAIEVMTRGALTNTATTSTAVCTDNHLKQYFWDIAVIDTTTRVNAINSMIEYIVMTRKATADINEKDNCIYVLTR